MPIKNILIIDDDQQLTQLLEEYFKPQGYSMMVCHDGRSGLQTATMRSDIDVKTGFSAIPIVPVVGVVPS